MNCRIMLMVLSIAYLPGIVNAGTVGKASKQQQKKEELTLAQFIQKVIVEGVDNDLRRLSDDFGLKPDHRTRAFERLEQDCSDNRYRTANVVVEKSSGTDRVQPVNLILLTTKKRPGAFESDLFKLKPDGTIEKAFRRSGKRIPDGHGVPGSAVDMEFDPDEAQRLLKRELDFWLKGIGLKKKPKSEVPPKTDAPAKPATK